MTENLLSAQELLEIDDRRFETVWVEPWKKNVRIRSMTAEEGLKFGQLGDQTESLIYGFCASACNDAGDLLFPAYSDELKKQLLKKGMGAFFIVQEAIFELNYMGEYAKKAVESTKNVSSEIGIEE